ncbi:DNA polymerase [Microbacterium sp.]|uniref:DNA polymerase n=1 Tax=Microbacterium sp. TaxID=51671 RepID=UPI002734C98A|nr:DNA polymerase [Microbacterium sp.]MDP3951886.1 DNA polymerase [Microbacterium sp.]
MLRLTEASQAEFTTWLNNAPRPHVGILAGPSLIIDESWEVKLRPDGALLQSLWTKDASGRLLWTQDGVVEELTRRSCVRGWEWVRSATTAWRVLHSSKGPALPSDMRSALAEVQRDRDIARYTLDATRFEAILATSSACGIRVDLAALDETRAGMARTHKQVTDVMGFDPLRESNDARTLGWLDRHGIRAASVHSDDWAARDVTRTALTSDAEHVYERVLYLRRRYPKVLELARATKRGKAHSRLEPFAQVSGRVSSTKPALNNIAADLRFLLVAEEGHTFITADYDGIEPRVLAGLSRDEVLAADLAHGDPYADAAERAGFDRVTHRKLMKIVMISTMYGASASRTARQLNVPLATAQRIRAALWAPYPVARAWLDAETGLTRPPLDSGRPLGVVERGYARPNLLIQSTAYDLFQAAALRVHDDLPRGARIALPMHDELVITSPIAATAAVQGVLRQHMPTTYRGISINATPVELGAHWRKA